MPGVLLRALSEYKFVGTPLWRMSDGKDLVRVELTFHKALPTKPYYKKRAESRRQPAPSAGEWPHQPAATTRPPTTTRSTLLDDSQLWRGRCHHHQRRHYQTLQDNTSRMISHRRQQLYSHRRSSLDQLHRLLLQNHHQRRSREQSRRRRRLHARSTSMLKLRKNTLYMRSTTSRMSPLQSTRPSLKLNDYQETTKKSTSTCQFISSSIETTNTGLSSRDLHPSSMTKYGTSTLKSFTREAPNNETQPIGTTPWRNRAVRGRWRTTTYSSSAAKLPWYDLLLNRSNLRHADLGEDTQ